MVRDEEYLQNHIKEVLGYDLGFTLIKRSDAFDGTSTRLIFISNDCFRIDEIDFVAGAEPVINIVYIPGFEAVEMVKALNYKFDFEGVA